MPFRFRYSGTGITVLFHIPAGNFHSGRTLVDRHISPLSCQYNEYQYVTDIEKKIQGNHKKTTDSQMIWLKLKTVSQFDTTALTYFKLIKIMRGKQYIWTTLLFSPH